jgi:PadR family transcriptional regulator PadR
MKRTQTLIAVAAALVEAPDRRWYGYALRRQARVESGTLYPVLRRMRTAGWIADDGYEFLPDRPVRRCFRVTQEGRRALLDILDGERRRRALLAEEAAS